MTFTTIVSAIRGRFKTTIGDVLPLPTVHDNAPEPAKATSWCRLRVDITNAEQVSTGSPPRFRTTGEVRAELYVANEKGDGALLSIADSITTAFRGVRLSDPQVTFFPPSPIGTSQLVGAWYRRDVRIQFRADTIGA